MLRSVLRLGLDLLYPSRCVHCGRFGALLCAPCIAAFEPATGVGRCRFCSASYAGADNCPRCLGMQSLDGARAAFEMSGPARAAVHALKYEGVEALAPLMAACITPLREATPFDVAFAVPLHSSRMRQRGFNQSALLLDATAWPRAPGELRRTRKTDQQVGMHLAERRGNVSGAFAYDGPSLADVTVALVDDVVTTGATANECAAVLRDHGARSVYAFAFTRASYNPGAST
jgi:ComF family protein